MNTVRETLSRNLIDEFIEVAHGEGRGGGGLTRVKEFVAQFPELVHAVHSDGDETGLGAAAHMGEREIVQFLLNQGAPLDISTAAMMGWRDRVARFLKQDSSLATATGAHGCALLYFVALSGDTEMADMILSHGGGDGLIYPLQMRNRPSIHGAVLFGHVSMTQWFLDYGADVTVRDYDDRTPLEAAVELGHDKVAALLRYHIGEDNLKHCSGCGRSGYRIVAKREGNRWATHTTYYTCSVCGTEMGSQDWCN